MDDKPPPDDRMTILPVEPQHGSQPFRRLGNPEPLAEIVIVERFHPLGPCFGYSTREEGSRSLGETTTLIRVTYAGTSALSTEIVETPEPPSEALKPALRAYTIVWNADRSEGFITNDSAAAIAALAMEVPMLTFSGNDFPLALQPIEIVPPAAATPLKADENKGD